LLVGTTEVKDGRAYAKDAGGTHGSFVMPNRADKISADGVEIGSGSRIVLAANVTAASTSITVTKVTMRFCTNRMENEDDKFKHMAQLAGGIVDSKPERCDYFVTNRFGISTKSLSAICLQKPIIRSEWLEFVENATKPVEIPSTKG
jgi:hypothetical protein